ncbi:TetR/AcrR family transcriptional regulator [Ramlibacter sp. AN1015]|uniref:TetR/AcrR family transcriptional regulator n=1 Tax=Ramlibacter sp. AN1015 TaxID=3133428 RepID=UPI0030BBB772
MPAKSPLSPAEPSPARRERRKQARPGELLDAALALFVEKGFAATRVEEIAARAGVSKGTLFLYFPNKEALFKAVVHENIAGHFAAWNAEFQSFEGSTADMLRHCMQAWWDRIGATPASGIPKLMMCEAQNFPEVTAYYQQEVVRPGKTLIRRILERGVARGEFAVDDMDAAVYAIVAPMIFLMLNQHALGACMPEEAVPEPRRLVALQAELLLRGLCSRGSDGARAPAAAAGDAAPAPKIDPLS